MRTNSLKIFRRRENRREDTRIKSELSTEVVRR
jgi:hypothetical protein